MERKQVIRTIMKTLTAIALEQEKELGFSVIEIARTGQFSVSIKDKSNLPLTKKEKTTVVFINPNNVRNDGEIFDKITNTFISMFGGTIIERDCLKEKADHIGGFELSHLG